MRRRRLIAPSKKLLFGILGWIIVLILPSEALRGSAVILQAKTKANEAKTQTEEENNVELAVNATTKSPLTGIPQIDYILDPNLPRELNGYNLTYYPFYNAVPSAIDFKCDGLHDGFYASVPHKCQVYHHCLYGTRYDFLCANYTAFDQKTFICHFVSEVDCENSPKYFKRNEALYKEASSSTSTTTTTTTTTTTAPTTAAAENNQGMRHGGHRVRPFRRRRPMYEYYYDDEEYTDSEYYEDDDTVAPSPAHRSISHRKQVKPQDSRHNVDSHTAESDYNSESSIPSSTASTSVYGRPRVLPKIRRPVPKNERDRYDYNSNNKQQTSNNNSKLHPEQTKLKQENTKQDGEYYDEDEEYDYAAEQKAAAQKRKIYSDYDGVAGMVENKRFRNRHRNRMPSRKRVEVMYEDDYDMEDIVVRPGRRKVEQVSRYDTDRPRNTRPNSSFRIKNSRVEEEESMPSNTHNKKPRPESEFRSSHRRRNQDAKESHPPEEYEYYYDKEELETEKPQRRNRRPNIQRQQDKPRKTSNNGISNQRYSHALELNTTAEGNVEKKTVSDKSQTNQSPKLNSNVEKDDAINNDYYYPVENSSIKRLSKTTTEKYSERNTENTSLNSLRHETEFTTAINKPKSTKNSVVNATAEKTSRTSVRHFVASAPKKVIYNFPNLEQDETLPESPPSNNLPPAYVNGNTHNRQPQNTRTINNTIKVQNNLPFYHSANGFSKVVTPANVLYNPEEDKFKQRINEAFIQSNRNQPVDSDYKPAVQSDTRSLYENGVMLRNPNIKSNPNLYRQSHRLFLGPDSSFTTNSITFPQNPPLYDLTAPGPSASGNTLPDNKYREPFPATYIADEDYDIRLNDALQPSTLHPVRNLPDTSGYQAGTQYQNRPSRVLQQVTLYSPSGNNNAVNNNKPLRSPLAIYK